MTYAAASLTEMQYKQILSFTIFTRTAIQIRLRLFSYLDLGLAQIGNKAYKSEYQKVVYYFTSAEQKTAFDKNSEKYLPQYGGYCAFGVYAGAKFRVDPNKFMVEDGKYYLFLNNVELDAKQLWLTENDHNGLAKKADANWKNLEKTHN